MADDSELDYIHTFLEAVTTSLAVETFETTRRIDVISGDKKALVYVGELMWIDGKFYKKRYLVKLSMETEITMMAIINEIIIGCYKYNNRTIGGYTYAAPMCNVNLAYGSRSFVTNNGRYKQDLWLDVEFASE